MLSQFTTSATKQRKDAFIFPDDQNALLMIGIVVFGAFISGGLVIVCAWVGGLPISW